MKLLVGIISCIFGCLPQITLYAAESNLEPKAPQCVLLSSLIPKPASVSFQIISALRSAKDAHDFEGLANALNEVQRLTLQAKPDFYRNYYFNFMQFLDYNPQGLSEKQIRLARRWLTLQGFRPTIVNAWRRHLPSADELREFLESTGELKTPEQIEAAFGTLKLSFTSTEPFGFVKGISELNRETLVVHSDHFVPNNTEISALMDAQHNLILFRVMNGKYIRKHADGKYTSIEKAYSYSLNPHIVKKWTPNLGKRSSENTVIIAKQNVIKEHLDFPSTQGVNWGRPTLGNRLTEKTRIGDIACLDEVKVPIEAENPIMLLSETDYNKAISEFAGKPFTILKLLEKLSRAPSLVKLSY